MIKKWRNARGQNKVCKKTEIKNTKKKQKLKTHKMLNSFQHDF